jgi:hypothetical protein
MMTDPGFQAWLAGRPAPGDPQQQYRAYTEVISSAVARGVVIRRARVVSEPVSDYVRWEHGLTEPINIKAGELVRWLPRRLASTLGPFPVEWTQGLAARLVGSFRDGFDTP